ncbi:hypothetical protein AMAG_02452 [Allomyces macrogynus ATCC 38327]|uniref:Uncharacterized protein n=1 Tax=Allomyces macrogynus (strain ATCC 38327) TaxID=578462 RepID=A0A0L0S286_ALLM3|nr:hypothetical protein AMAG_02452 [Allomyces macrogynus ATCC 38327]|eukprot:KNE56668.1 hypothetical protein AMAG_02452 [Allomyces macrogynus ATCC 38327]
MKISNTLLLATATAALAMAAVPAVDAQSLSFGGFMNKAGLLTKDARDKYEVGMNSRVKPSSSAVKTTAIRGGLPLTSKSWTVRKFATEDAPSAVGAPTTNAGTPTTTPPKAHPRRRTRRGHRRPRRHRGRRNSSAARRRRRHHRPTHGHGPSQGRANSIAAAISIVATSPTAVLPAGPSQDVLVVSRARY